MYVYEDERNVIYIHAFRAKKWINEIIEHTCIRLWTIVGVASIRNKCSTQLPISFGSYEYTDNNIEKHINNIVKKQSTGIFRQRKFERDDAYEERNTRIG